MKKRILIFFLTLITLSNLFANEESLNRGLQAESAIFFSEEDNNLCVVNALYLGLKFLGEKNVSYQVLLDEFPNVKKNGVKLSQARVYLEEKGFHCRELEGRARYLLGLDKNVMVFLLKRSADPEKISHVFLARVLKNETLQIFNLPERTRNISKENLKDTKVFCLLVARDPKLLPRERFFSGLILVFSWISLAAIVIGLFLFFRNQRRKYLCLSGAKIEIEGGDAI